MNRRIAVCVLSGLGALMSCGHARGQTVPPKVPPNLQSGAIQKQNQKIREYHEQQSQQREADRGDEPVITSGPSPEARSSNAKLSFVLKRVAFDKSAFLDPAQLHAVVAPYVGKRVTFTTLQHIVDAVNALYRANNVVTAQAVLPPQTIHDGTVHIALIEGKLGKVEVRGNRNTKTGFIRNRIPVASGQFVKVDTLQHALVYFNRTSDVRLQALLEPGATLGLTNIVLNAAEPPRMSGDVFVDNAGVDSTSRNRIGATFSYNSLFGVTDRLDAYVAHSRGDTDGSVSYSLPVDRHNGRIAVSFARASTRIINGPFSKLDLTGHSNTATVSLTQPLVANRRWLLAVNGAFSRIKSSNDAAGVNISNSGINQFDVGFSATYFGERQRISTSHVVSEAKTDQTLDGHSTFFIYNGSVSDLGRLWEHWGYQLSLAGQLASNDHLAPSLLFQLGGLGSVRGFERGVLAGPSGYLATAALHRYVGEKWDIYGFVDHGQVFAAFPHSDHLSGAGLGTYWQPRHWVSLSLDVARPFDTVTSYQRGTRIDFRVSVHWDAN